MKEHVYSELANNYPNTTATPMADPPPTDPPELFTDDFGDGDDEGWIDKAGDWHVEDGAYRNSYMHPSWWGYYSQLTHVYQDFSMEADLKINSALEEVNWAGFFFRFPVMFGGRGEGGYLVYLRQNGILGIHNAVDGTVASVEDAVSDTSVFHRLRITCTGRRAHILVFLDGEFKLEWADPNSRFDSGFVALESGHTDCTFDNVVIRDLTPSGLNEAWEVYR